MKNILPIILPWIVVIIVCSGIVYLGYDSGYNKGFSTCESYYLGQLNKVTAAQKQEHARVTELESKLAQVAAEYEVMSTKLTDVQKDNEKWKSQAEDAKKQALGLSTVQRINEVLKSYSQQ